MLRNGELKTAWKFWVCEWHLFTVHFDLGGLFTWGTSDVSILRSCLLSWSDIPEKSFSDSFLGNERLAASFLGALREMVVFDLHSVHAHLMHCFYSGALPSVMPVSPSPDTLCTTGPREYPFLMVALFYPFKNVKLFAGVRTGNEQGIWVLSAF